MTEDSRPQPYSLRLEPETRAKIEALAKANGRSLNAQIVLMLDEWLSGSWSSDSQSLTAEDVRRIALELIRDELSKAGLVPDAPEHETGFSIPMQRRKA